MPLPSPRGKESKDDFISRCVSELHGAGEFDSQDQRLAVCYSQWRDSKESIMKTIKIEKEVRIPGTNVVLEAGDRIKIESRQLQEADPAKNDLFLDIEAAWRAGQLTVMRYGRLTYNLRGLYTEPHPAFRNTLYLRVTTTGNREYAFDSIGIEIIPNKPFTFKHQGDVISFM